MDRRLRPLAGREGPLSTDPESSIKLHVLKFHFQPKKAYIKVSNNKPKIAHRGFKKDRYALALLCNPKQPFSKKDGGERGVLQNA